jgi:hypothetical protein
VKSTLLQFATVIILIGFTACNNDSVEPATEIPDILITRELLGASGGDPRGAYVPNAPFVHYFGILADSLSSTSGSGSLDLRGSSSTSGTFTFGHTPGVGGTIGSIIYAILPVKEMNSGLWGVVGNRMIIQFESRSDTVAFTANAKGLVLIVPYFNSLPPLSVNNVDHPTQSANDSTVWVFKKL